jgi:hypothetical protein
MTFNGIIRLKYIDNFFTGKSNSIAISTILELILSDTDELELSSFSQVYISGDTGNGFRGYDHCDFYSSLYSRFGIIFEELFLCPRHAYNICDTHGGQLSQRHHELLTSCDIISVRDFAEVVAAGISNTVAYYHEQKLPSTSKKQTHGNVGIRQLGQLQFVWHDSDNNLVSTKGVFRGQRLSRRDEWIYFDTRIKSKLCVPCTGNRMRPVVKHDSKSDCPFYKELLEGEARRGLAFKFYWC